MLSVGLCRVSLSYTGSVTFLLQSELSLGLNILQGCSQVPRKTAGAVGHQQGALQSHRGHTWYKVRTQVHVGLKQLSGLEGENVETLARLPHQYWKGQPEYLWAGVASQCCCSELQRGRRAWFRLMDRQAWITIQLRAKHLREETHREREEIGIENYW